MCACSCVKLPLSPARRAGAKKRGRERAVRGRKRRGNSCQRPRFVLLFFTFFFLFLFLSPPWAASCRPLSLSSFSIRTGDKTTALFPNQASPCVSEEATAAAAPGGRPAGVALRSISLPLAPAPTARRRSICSSSPREATALKDARARTAALSSTG